MIQSYLSERTICHGEVNKQLTSGVPQGSVLGPTLWNIFFDDVLDLPFEAGVEITAYADDIAMLVIASDVDELNRKANDSLHAINTWMKSNSLEIAENKTEAVILKGPRNRTEVDIYIKGVSIEIKKTLKYLGVWLDGQGYFGEHTLQAIKKAETRVSALGRTLPEANSSSKEGY